MFGLFDFFRSRSRQWASDRHRREAESFLTHIRQLGDADVGFILAIAAHQRNKLRDQGIDLSRLADLAAARPMYHHELAKAVNALARAKRAHDALGLQVWVHSLRAASDPAIRQVGADIWLELRRGVGHLPEQRAYFKEQTGYELDISHGGEPPVDFDPSR